MAIDSQAPAQAEMEIGMCSRERSKQFAPVCAGFELQNMTHETWCVCVCVFYLFQAMKRRDRDCALKISVYVAGPCVCWRLAFGHATTGTHTRTYTHTHTHMGDICFPWCDLARSSFAALGMYIYLRLQR